MQCVGRVYCRLQQQAERVSLVCKALEYVGDIMKFIKPNLLNKSTEGLHITYWTLGLAQYTLYCSFISMTKTVDNLTHPLYMIQIILRIL